MADTCNGEACFSDTKDGSVVDWPNLDMIEAYRHIKMCAKNEWPGILQKLNPEVKCSLVRELQNRRHSKSSVNLNPDSIVSVKRSRVVDASNPRKTRRGRPPSSLKAEKASCVKTPHTQTHTHTHTHTHDVKEQDVYVPHTHTHTHTAGLKAKAESSEQTNEDRVIELKLSPPVITHPFNLNGTSLADIKIKEGVEMFPTDFLCRLLYTSGDESEYVAIHTTSQQQPCGKSCRSSSPKHRICMEYLNVFLQSLWCAFAREETASGCNRTKKQLTSKTRMFFTKYFPSEFNRIENECRLHKEASKHVDSADGSDKGETLEELAEAMETTNNNLLLSSQYCNTNTEKHDLNLKLFTSQAFQCEDIISTPVEDKNKMASENGSIQNTNIGMCAGEQNMVLEKHKNETEEQEPQGDGHTISVCKYEIQNKNVEENNSVSEANNHIPLNHTENHTTANDTEANDIETNDIETNHTTHDTVNDTTNHITNDIVNDTAIGTTNHIINDTTNHTQTNDTTNETTNHIKTDTTDDTTNPITNDTTNHTQTNDTTNDIANHITTDTANDTTNDITNDTTNDTTNYITTDTANDITNDITNDTTNHITNETVNGTVCGCVEFQKIREYIQPNDRHEERLRLRDIRTKHMSHSDYLEFCKQRDRSIKKSKTSFIQWIQFCINIALGKLEKQQMPSDFVSHIMFIIQDRICSIVELASRWSSLKDTICLSHTNAKNHILKNCTPVVLATNIVNNLSDNQPKSEPTPIPTPPEGVANTNDAADVSSEKEFVYLLPPHPEQAKEEITYADYCHSIEILYELIDRPLFNIHRRFESVFPRHTDEG